MIEIISQKAPEYKHKNFKIMKSLFPNLKNDCKSNTVVVLTGEDGQDPQKLHNDYTGAVRDMIETW